MADLQEKLGEIRERLNEIHPNSRPGRHEEVAHVVYSDAPRLLEAVKKVHEYCLRKSDMTEDDMPDDLSREAWGQMLIDDIEYKLKAILVEDGNNGGN